MPEKTKRYSIWEKLKDNLFILGTTIPSFLYLFAFLLIVLFYLLKFSFGEGLPILSVFSEIEFRKALLRTFWFMLIGTPLQLFVGIVLALLVYESFKGVGLIRSLFLIPIAIPALVTAVVINLLFSYPFGHINDLFLGKYIFFPKILELPLNFSGSEFLSIGLAMLGKVWRDMPISMLIILAGLQTIEKEGYEAAQIMGANFYQRFKYITLPLLTPVISTVLILRSIENWKEFIFPFIIAPAYPLLGVLIERLYHIQQNPHLAGACALWLVLFIGATTFLFTFLTKTVRAYLVKV
jgi:ABC-type sugar transport system permease subunit